MRNLVVGIFVLVLGGCVVADETNPGLSASWDDRRVKAEALEAKLWADHKGFPTFSTRNLPDQETREVFLAFAALIPDGAYVLGDETRFVIDYRYSNERRLGDLRTATYEVMWRERDTEAILYRGKASTICQFTDALIARPPDCDSIKASLLLTALSELS